MAACLATTVVVAPEGVQAANTGPGATSAVMEHFNDAEGRFPRFVDAVPRRCGLPPELAAAVARVDPATARSGTGAVFVTLREAVTVREFREMVSRLPRADDGAVGPVPPEPFTR